MIISTLLAAQLVLPPFITKTQGSCAEDNLAFQTLRINKIPLPSSDETKRLEARFLVYLNEDGTYQGRYTENLVLSCSTGPQGEVCQNKPLKTEKFSGTWDYDNVQLKLSEMGIGEVADYNGIPILKFHFESEHFTQVSGQNKTGWMVQINLDQNGKTAESYCSNAY